MSATDDDGEEIPGREVAYRLFAAEYDDASLSYAESDEERAPNYVVSPTGARLNRVFVVGTLTEITSVNEEMLRARVVDPTGAFVVYAGQYQPDELAALEQLEPPAFVAVTGKARTFEPDDGDQVYTSIRPESIATVDADTRDRWVVSAAEQTIDRVGTYAEAITASDTAPDEAVTDALREAGVDAGLAAGIPLASDHYDTTPDYLAALRDCAVEAVEVVADERDEVSGLSIAPAETDPEIDASFDALAAHADLSLESAALADEGDERPAETAAATPGASEPESTAITESIDAGSAAGTATGTDREVASGSDADAAAEGADSFDDAAGETTAEAASSASSASSEPTIDEPASDEPAADDDDLEPVDESAVDAGTEDEVTTAEPTASFDETTDVDEPDDDLGDFDADSGMYEMDEEEREQLEEEFGAEFTTGSEVDEPGEADIDVPAPDEPAADAEAETTADPVSSEPTDDIDLESGDEAADDDLGAPPASGLEPDDEAGAEPEPAEPEPDAESDDGADEPAADVDLEAYVVERMDELDGGDGADREELVAAVVDDTGADEGAVEDAIQDALMGGQCYEPDDGRLKAI